MTEETPRTEAGQRLLHELDGDSRWFSFREDIVAIEREAVTLSVPNDTSVAPEPQEGHDSARS